MNSFHISQRKHVVVLTRSTSGEALLMSTHNMFLLRNKRDTDTFFVEKRALSRAMLFS